MTMEADRQSSEGRTRLTLGPVEKAIVGILATVLLSGAWKFADSINIRFDKQYDAINELSKQQAVTSGQITTLTAQLADIPAMRTNVAEIKVRVEAHDQAIRELRATKGLR